MTKKKPATKKPAKKRVTIAVLEGRVSRDVGALLLRIAGLEERVGRQSMDIGPLVKHSVTSSKALDILDSGQRVHASMISELQRKLSPPVGKPTVSREDMITLADKIANFARQQPPSRICTDKFRDDVREMALAMFDGRSR